MGQAMLAVKVYGANGHRQRASFEPSVSYDWSDGEKIRRIEMYCADKTKTNDYVTLLITRNTIRECEEELRGQISDGIFENCRVGRVEEISRVESA